MFLSATSSLILPDSLYYTEESFLIKRVQSGILSVFGKLVEKIQLILVEQIWSHQTGFFFSLQK
jgi:hypothetical protein